MHTIVILSLHKLSLLCKTITLSDPQGGPGLTPGAWFLKKLVEEHKVNASCKITKLGIVVLENTFADLN
jgi:hypothetical protein